MLSLYYMCIFYGYFGSGYLMPQAATASIIEQPHTTKTRVHVVQYSRRQSYGANRSKDAGTAALAGAPSQVSHFSVLCHSSNIPVYAAK